MTTKETGGARFNKSKKKHVRKKTRFNKSLGNACDCRGRELLILFIVFYDSVNQFEGI